MNTLAKWAIAVILAGPYSAFGANVQYNLNFTVGGQTVTGDIVTDGAVGPLGTSDILGGTIVDSLGSFSFPALVGIELEDSVGAGFSLEASGSALVFDPVGLGLSCITGANFCGIVFNVPPVPGPYNPAELGLQYQANRGPSAALALAYNQLPEPAPEVLVFAPYQAVTLGTAVPLPPAALLLLSGFAGLGLLGRRRQQNLPV